MITFQEALHDSDGSPMIIAPCCKTEVSGFFTACRVDRKTVPAGWYIYDIRHNDSGRLSTIEEHVLVNHAGCFLCQKPIHMNKHGYYSLQGRGGYTFSEHGGGLSDE